MPNIPALRHLRESSFKEQLHSIFLVLGLLSIKDKRKAILLTVLQAFLGLLDMIAVGLFGVVASLGLRQVQSLPPGDKTQALLEIVGLNKINITSLLPLLLCAAIGLLILRSLLSLWFHVRTMYFLGLRAANLSITLVESIIAKPKSMLQQKSLEERKFSSFNGVNVLYLGVLGSSISLLGDIATLILVIAIIAIVDTLTAVIAGIGLLTIATGLYRKVSRKSAVLGSKLGTKEKEGAQKFAELFLAYRENRVLGRTETLLDLIYENRKEVYRISAQRNFLPTLGKYVFEITVIVIATLSLLFQLISNDFTRAFATFTVLLAGSSRMLPAILRIYQSMIIIKSGIAYSEPTLIDLSRFVKTKDIKSQYSINSHVIGKPVDREVSFQPKIKITSLSFNYPGSSRRIISDLSVEVEQGDFLAVTGRSGIGKSTFLDLILGLEIATYGNIQISNELPNDAFRKWPGKIGYVPQSPYFIDDSALQNISMNSQRNEVAEQSEQDLFKFVELDNPENGGLIGSEPVGDYGAKLSGGQKQRLALARSLYSRPEILIMDEFGSALDVKSKKILFQKILNLEHIKVLIVVTHDATISKYANKTLDLLGHGKHRLKIRSERGF